MNRHDASKKTKRIIVAVVSAILAVCLLGLGGILLFGYLLFSNIGGPIPPSSQWLPLQGRTGIQIVETMGEEGFGESMEACKFQFADNKALQSVIQAYNLRPPTPAGSVTPIQLPGYSWWYTMPPSEIYAWRDIYGYRILWVDRNNQIAYLFIAMD